MLLSKSPSYGYQLIKDLKESCLCRSIDTGNFYRMVNRLEKEGVLKSRSEGGREKKIYTLTPKGRKFLEGWAAALQKNKELIDLFLQKFS